MRRTSQSHGFSQLLLKVLLRSLKKCLFELPVHYIKQVTILHTLLTHLEELDKYGFPPQTLY